MSIRVRADIFDLRHDIPRSTDVFFIDTNVWFWVGYDEASEVQSGSQIADYGYYLIQGYGLGAAFFYMPLSLPELSHSIELAEWQRVKRDTNQPNMSFKHFRRTYHAARRQTLTAIDGAWDAVLTLCGDNCLSIVADEAMYPAFLATFGAVALDGYDVLMLNAMREAGITRIITDDADFGQVEGMQVLTANAYLLEQAEQQGRLLKR